MKTAEAKKVATITIVAVERRESPLGGGSDRVERWSGVGGEAVAAAVIASYDHALERSRRLRERGYSVSQSEPGPGLYATREDAHGQWTVDLVFLVDGERADAFPEWVPGTYGRIGDSRTEVGPAREVDSPGSAGRQESRQIEDESRQIEDPESTGSDPGSSDEVLDAGSGEDAYAPMPAAVDAVGRAQSYDGTYTVVREDGSYRTMRLQTRREDGTGWGGETFVEVLSGPDNESSYTSVGLLKKDGRLVLWRRHRGGAFESSVRADVAVLLGDPSACSRAYGLRSGRCGVCGRRLTVPESIERGIGPVCAERTGY